MCGFDHFITHQVKQLSISAESIAQETRKNPQLRKIVQQLETDFIRLQDTKLQKTTTD